MARPEFLVNVDAWENQRYKPLQGGWQAPFKTYLFSDITGNFEVAVNESLGHPVSTLPPGWEWTGQWDVDASLPYPFGHCDSEGWSYGSSFESLFDASLKKLLSGEMGRLSLVRRRRWVRTRRCVSESAKQQFQAAIFWNQSLRQRLDMVSSSKESDFALLQQFENKRRTAFDDAITLADNILHETVQMLEGVGEKLGHMKSFLQERGRIEREYSRNLEELALKWKYAGQHPNYMPAADGSPPPNAGFFFVVSSANQIFSSCLGDFASLLDGSLPLDVEGIIQEVFAVKNDCTYEGPLLRASLRSKEDILQLALAGYKQAFTTSRIFSATESVRLLSALYSGSASEMADNSTISVLARSNTMHSTASEGFPGSPGGKSAGGPRFATSSSGQRFDVWQSMQRYYRAVSEADAELLVYCAFATQQRKIARMTGSRVAALLQSTVKVFAHEQCRAFEDGVTELRKVGSRIAAQATPSSSSSSSSQGSADVVAPPMSRSTTGLDPADEELLLLINPSLPTIPHCGSVAQKGFLSCALSSLPPHISARLLGASSSPSYKGSRSSSGVYNMAPSTPTSSSAEEGSQAQGGELQWVRILAIVTFDGTLLLYSAESDVYHSSTTESAAASEVEGGGGGEGSSPDGQEDAESQPSYSSFPSSSSSSSAASSSSSSSWIDTDPIAVADLNGSLVEPLLLLGLDAFVIRPRPYERSPFQMMSPPPYPSPSSAAGSSGNSSKGEFGHAGNIVTSLALLAGNPDNMREWMRVLSTPMQDPALDPPEWSN